MSLYTSFDMIKGFRHGIVFSSQWNKEDMIPDPCSKLERVNMAITGGSCALYFLLEYSCYSQSRGSDLLYAF